MNSSKTKKIFKSIVKIEEVSRLCGKKRSQETIQETAVHRKTVGRNGQVRENITHKTEPERNRKHERIITSHGNEELCQ